MQACRRPWVLVFPAQNPLLWRLEELVRRPSLLQFPALDSLNNQISRSSEAPNCSAGPSAEPLLNGADGDNSTECPGEEETGGFGEHDEPNALEDSEDFGDSRDPEGLQLAGFDLEDMELELEDEDDDALLNLAPIGPTIDTDATDWCACPALRGCM